MSNLENSFKDALSNFDEVSVSSGLWARISATLLLKSLGFRIVAISLLSLLLVGIPSYFLIPVEQNTISENKIDNHKLNFDNINDNKKAQLASSEKNITKPQSSESDFSSEKINNTNNTSIKNSEKDSEITRRTNEQNKRATKEILIVNNAQQSKKTDNTLRKSNGKTSQTKLGSTISTSPSKTTKVKDSPIAETGDLESLGTAISLRDESEIKPENYPHIKGLDDISVYYSFDDDFTAIKKPILIHKKYRYTRKFEIFAGPNIAFNQMNIEDHNYQSLLDLRKQNESPKLSYHVGINYKNYYNKWFVSVGINYHRIEDRISYSIKAFDIDTIISSYMIFNTTYQRTIVGYIPNPNDSTSTIPVYSTSVKQDTTHVNQAYYDSTETKMQMSLTNTYAYIEVPLIIGKEFNFKTLVFDLSGGVSWNRLIKYNLSIPQENANEFIKESDLEQIIVKNTFNGIVSLGMGYRIRENSIIFLRPELRYNLNKIFTNSYPINQKYLQVRLSVGMRIKL